MLTDCPKHRRLNKPRPTNDKLQGRTRLPLSLLNPQCQKQLINRQNNRGYKSLAAAADVAVTLMLVLPDLDGMLKSFDKGMLFGSTDVHSKSSLDHWILQVTSGQFKHLRLVIPMTNFNEDDWPTLSRVFHVDLVSKRCGLM